MLAGLARPTIFRPTLACLASGVPSSVLSRSCLSPYPTLSMARFHNTQAFVTPLNGPMSKEDAEAEKACRPLVPFHHPPPSSSSWLLIAVIPSSTCC
ncbi:hypothetical protein FOZ63_029418 [Perkinsus olseni]|uniref:Uncharacterized protein n=1 Tax=Perkinsus olseni TaxID=32597 RepID=A0A7J6RER7_PEROL|nr:hypothetical protein FOZ63_029418 [Perkinsus olseni]KAF4750546.1 hypothetical protein FOZ62_007159 [Perkinsus olseni]